MSTFWLILLLVLTFGICWWDAYVAGKIWLETKATGGWMRAVCWSAAIMAASGFTMIFSTILGFLAYAAGYLPIAGLHFLLSLDYLLVIFPILGAGAIITIQSWIVAYRERSLLNMGVASYNTFAMAYDTYNAIDGVGEAFKTVWGTLTDVGSDSDNKWLGIALALMALALGGGIFLTVTIVQHAMGTLPLPERSDGIPAR